MNTRDYIVSRAKELGIEELVYQADRKIVLKLADYKTAEGYLVYFGDKKVHFFTGNDFKAIGYSRIKDIYKEGAW